MESIQIIAIEDKKGDAQCFCVALPRLLFGSKDKLF